MKVLFKSNFSEHGSLKDYSQATVKNEPQFFSADLNFAMEHGGDITKDFIKNLPDEFKNSYCVLDSKVHMLMPGWFPCIPGIHVDDVPRTRSDGQPDHINPVYKADHAMAIVGDASITQFVIGDIELEDIPVGGGIISEKWHSDIAKMIEDNKVSVKNITPNKIVLFDWQAFHQGMPATKNGWRLFIRATINTHRPIHNEIRMQAQVYMTNPFVGW